MIKTFNVSPRINIWIALSIIVLILMGHVVSSAFLYAALLLFCLSIFVVSKELTICNLFMLVHFAVLFKLSPTSMSLFTICELAVLVWFLVKGKINFTVVAAAAAYLAYLLIGSIFEGSFDLAEIVKQIAILLLLAYFVKEYPIKNYARLFTYFVVGLIIASLVGWFGEVLIPNFHLYVEKVGYNTEIQNRFAGLQGDPNYYSIGVILGLSALAVMYRNRIVKSIVFWLAFATLSFFGLQTYSKSFLLMYAIVLVVVLSQTFKTRKILNYVIFAVVFVLLISLASVEGSVINLTLERLLSAESTDQLTTNRSAIWREYASHIVNNVDVLFLGEGINAGLLGTHGAHNFYLELLYYFGVLGTCVYVLAFVACFKTKRKTIKVKRHPINYIGWIILSVMFFFLQMVFAFELIFYLFLAYMIYKHNDNDQIESIEKKAVSC